MQGRYAPLATLEQRGNIELYELVKEINNDLEGTEYVILDVPYDDLVVAREDEDGDWEVCGQFDDDEHGDQYEATDPIAENASDHYLVAAQPYGNRVLIYDHSSDE